MTIAGQLQSALPHAERATGKAERSSWALPPEYTLLVLDIRPAASPFRHSNAMRAINIGKGGEGGGNPFIW